MKGERWGEEGDPGHTRDTTNFFCRDRKEVSKRGHRREKKCGVGVSVVEPSSPRSSEEWT